MIAILNQDVHIQWLIVMIMTNALMITVMKIPDVNIQQYHAMIMMLAQWIPVTQKLVAFTPLLSVPLWVSVSMFLATLQSAAITPQLIVMTTMHAHTILVTPKQAAAILPLFVMITMPVP
jgi:hypothetical protein